MINYEDHLNLVYKIAGRYAKTKDQFEDYSQEGILALLAAINKFDESREIKFSTYAYKYIEGYILLYINRKEKLITVRNSKKNIQVYPLDNFIRSEHDDKESEFQDFLLIDNDFLEKANNFEEKLLNIEKIKIYLSILSKKNKRLLYKRYCEEKSYRDIAAEEGTSHQSVQQSVELSIKKIRKIFKLGEEYGDNKEKT